MKLLRGTLIALLLVVVAFAEAAAQSRIKDIDVHLNGNDLTARTSKRLDNNGNPCGLLKVSVLADNVEFQGNVIGDVVRHGGTYWVYVTNGTKEIHMDSPAFGEVALRFAEWGIPRIESLAVYTVTVELAEAAAAAVRRGYVQFSITPANAFIEFNGQQLDVTDGAAYKLVPYGSYSYKVQAAGHEPQSGIVTVNSDKVQVPVKLRSNKARVTVTAETPGSTIYVDGAMKGKAPWQGELIAGSYVVEARHEGYRPREVSVTLAAATERNIAIPALEMIIGELNIEYQPIGSQVILDGKTVGTTPLSFSEVAAGTHTVTIAHSGYDTATLSVTVSETGTAPVTGTLKKTTEKDIPAIRRKIEQAYNNKNYEKARELALTISNDATAQFYLGRMYEKGYGVAKDDTQAVEWYRKAAQQGNASAQTNLGFMYKNGYGVAKDYAQAVEWYRKAAQQGNANAQNNLGVMYKNGYGVAKDYTQAVEWYRKAAQQGNALAQSNLGFMYKNGYGVAKDINEARRWYEKAAAQGNQNAKDALKRL
ncbi:MAG: PEGA domain-containing protein [Bacteroidales bacterium]|nr:PEGA domain-containing protein [Bacteroidales bacterium]